MVNILNPVAKLKKKRHQLWRQREEKWKIIPIPNRKIFIDDDNVDTILYYNQKWNEIDMSCYQHLAIVAHTHTHVHEHSSNEYKHTR